MIVSRSFRAYDEHVRAYNNHLMNQAMGRYQYASSIRVRMQV